jgi:4-diphosphocytidyl-2-C-methyl-D-erythritol kinase
MSQTRINLCAPAKLNLHLDIGSKRDDGYHLLRSLFVKIDLFDRITVDISESRRYSCRIDGGIPVPEEHNTLYHAAALFCKAAGITGSFSVTCDKNIPVQAGLGGGSSDAAALLVGLNDYFGHPLGRGELLAAAQKIGSDVPFFLSSSPSFVSGRGETVKPFDMDDDQLKGLLVYPHFTVSTADAYRDLDLLREGGPEFQWSLDGQQIEEAYGLNPDQWPYFNSFSAQLYQRYPDYHTIESLLYQAGCQFVSISGSGSSIFGLSKSEDPDPGVLEGICSQNGWELFTIKTLADRRNAVYN